MIRIIGGVKYMRIFHSFNNASCKECDLKFSKCLLREVKAPRLCYDTKGFYVYKKC